LTTLNKYTSNVEIDLKLLSK